MRLPRASTKAMISVVIVTDFLLGLLRAGTAHLAGVLTPPVSVRHLQPKFTAEKSHHRYSRTSKTNGCAPET
jgi:hypothetical protein